MSAANVHPAALQGRQSAQSAAQTAAPLSDAAWSARFAAQPDLFLPRDGSPSKGYADPKQRGVGAGVVLDQERAQATFHSQELMLLLYGGKEVRKEMSSAQTVRSELGNH
jgi:hypothetical protein